MSSLPTSPVFNRTNNFSPTSKTKQDVHGNVTANAKPKIDSLERKSPDHPASERDRDSGLADRKSKNTSNELEVERKPHSPGTRTSRDSHNGRKYKPEKETTESEDERKANLPVKRTSRDSTGYNGHPTEKGNASVGRKATPSEKVELEVELKPHSHPKKTRDSTTQPQNEHASVSLKATPSEKIELEVELKPQSHSKRSSRDSTTGDTKPQNEPQSVGGKSKTETATPSDQTHPEGERKARFSIPHFQMMHRSSKTKLSPDSINGVLLSDPGVSAAPPPPQQSDTIPEVVVVKPQSDLSVVETTSSGIKLKHILKSSMEQLSHGTRRANPVQFQLQEDNKSGSNLYLSVSSFHDQATPDSFRKDSVVSEASRQKQKKPDSSDSSSSSDEKEDKPRKKYSEGSSEPVKLERVVVNESMATMESIGSNMSKGTLGSNVSNATFNDTTLGKLLERWRVMERKVLESEYYRVYRSVLDSSRNVIFSVALSQGIVFGSIFYVLQCVLNSTLPSIRFYNLIHAVVALQGKLLLALGWELSHLVKKGFAALEMKNEKKGIPLTDVAFVNPQGCRSINRMFLGVLVMIECGLWILSFLMDWSPVATYLGNYACSPLQYNQPFIFTTNDLSTWVDADLEFATIYEYGLPMASGIIGGTPSIPLFSPAVNFQMEGPGVAYMIQTTCNNATVSHAHNTTKSTSQILFQQMWGSVYTAGIQITMPAGTHGWKEYTQHDLTQECQFTVVSGAAEIQMLYITDIWGVIVPVGISKMTVGGISLTQANSLSLDFGVIHHAFGESETTYQDITQDIARGVQMVLNSTDLKSDVAITKYAQLFDWGMNPTTGLYDPSITWRSVSAAIGIVGHYVLDQNNGGAINELCPYMGTAGLGTIEAPALIATILLVLLICGTTMMVVVTSAWLLVVGGGEHIDRCVQMIDDPLRTIYYMRDSDLVTTIRGNDIGRISLEQHLSKVNVRFGELKSTRGNEVGSLTLNEPSKVVKLSRSRKVV
ncbi:hypothetical protein HDU98_010637 [Podochytrium sp. JEL0797]|nr:hypothetical protein HDU98_010637 [Podochytrium sp. JEL0797]